jgi:hypothetical protein
MISGITNKLVTVIKLSVLTIVASIGVFIFIYGSLWLIIFSMMYVKNSIGHSIPNPMFLADCLSLEDEYLREHACTKVAK